jgi:hypothetical protein
MTGQLESDLRALLATRANEVTADLMKGEEAIAQRLATGERCAGERSLGQVAVIRSPHRGPFPIAAAAVAIVLISAAVILANHDGTVDTTALAPTATTPSAPSTQDPTLGTPAESAKDVVERFAHDVLHEEWVTTAAEERDQATFVTIETAGGAALTARLVFDMDLGAYRLTELASPGLSATETDGQIFVDLPAAGALTISGFDERLETETPYVTPGATVPSGRAGPYTLPHDDTVWVSILVQAADGTALRLITHR